MIVLVPGKSMEGLLLNATEQTFCCMRLGFEAGMVYKSAGAAIAVDSMGNIYGEDIGQEDLKKYVKKLKIRTGVTSLLRQQIHFTL
jgi:hypothetical protein